MIQQTHDDLEDTWWSSKFENINWEEKAYVEEEKTYGTMKTNFYIEKENPRNFCKLKMKLRCGEKQRIKCKRKQKKLLKIIETRNKNHYRYLSLLAVFDIPKHYVLSA